jgi:hypothetical protein
VTGKDVKQKAIVTLRSHVWNMPSPEAAEEACAEALAALYPCIVLTAEEATAVRMTIVALAPAELIPEEEFRVERLLALLTPNQEASVGDSN